MKTKTQLCSKLGDVNPACHRASGAKRPQAYIRSSQIYIETVTVGLVKSVAVRVAVGRSMHHPVLVNLEIR